MSAEFDERVMTVPLRDVLAESKGQRADKAMSLVRSHLAQHFNVEEDAVRLDPSINEAVWERGRSKPPSELRVRAARFEEEGEAVVEAETA
ncbi:50S ribosomal protein L31e [Natronomonas pharaonis DSM 2160]|uniref:Large ribosomal subunit protein eL31 n=1 Tax=Natronomonas pharaonis (strain ATCC 35678 / DSM 2160 / CIP 103997 / JCM 8858 / NBRC 14720 / NCIMB 2260 / Gabara) TaxID=348780 RepID=RL31_NATPD|nr:50S ribosomal protein L31e [Natronomonas pharaonis]Q3ITD6.1 RecName: Full=Large ribosomal subunit protein eL31; AltName: Full=50S ribosomal protein L31e [Natronomonas pharaonis DSM 2160]CAI48598.1 50S ribosomal protein L31e [Natronomonas pharaonis DSM 2160]